MQINNYKQISTTINKYEQTSTLVNQISININKYEQMWININKYRNRSTKYKHISTNINKCEQISRSTTMNQYQQIWTTRPIAFLLNSHYVKTMWKASHGSPNLSAEQSQEQKSIKHKSEWMNINMIQYST